MFAERKIKVRILYVKNAIEVAIRCSGRVKAFILKHNSGKNRDAKTASRQISGKQRKIFTGNFANIASQYM